MALIGVLALQGAFSEHMEVLRKLNIQSFPVKTIKDFQQSFDGLIIPGGESTTIMMLAERSGILDELKRLVKSGFPIWGVCAGCIILSNEATQTKIGGQKLLGGLDICVKRNAFGHAKHSFCQSINFEGLGEFPGVFIRAPLIVNVHEHVVVLARIEQGIVAVRQGNLLGTAFHPELTDDDRLHRFFLDIVWERKKCQI